MKRDIESEVLNSAYIPLPETGPYLSYARFDAPKETTKFFCRQAASLLDPDKTYTWADIGCANGEMIHHFKKHMPNVKFTGFDNVQAYIDSANAHPTLTRERATFECKALEEVSGQFDIVSYFGIITTYWDWREPFTKLLSLCKPGGYILVDGFFSHCDVLRCADDSRVAAQARGAAHQCIHL